MLEIYAALFKTAQNKDRLSDPAYLRTAKVLGTISKTAEWFSLPELLYLIGAVSDEEPEFALRSDDDEFQAQIDKAILKASERLGYHISHRTIFGGLLWFSMRLLPKRVAKKEANEVAAKSFQPLLNMSYRA
jgi:hypothetical protein